MSIGKKIVLWIAFLPGGLIGSLLVFAVIQVVFAAPYLLFDVLPALGILGGIPAYLASLWVFLYLSWFIAPTKSRVEAWIILVTAAFISLNAILYGISVMDRGCTQLFAAIVGLGLLFRFYRGANPGTSQYAAAALEPSSSQVPVSTSTSLSGLARLVVTVAVGAMSAGLMGSLVAAAVGEWSPRGGVILLDAATWFTVASVVAWALMMFLIIVRSKAGDVRLHAWPRILALIASGLMVLAPFFRLTEHPLVGGLMLYELSVPCAVCFAAAAATAFLGWLRKIRVVQFALLPVFASLVAWLVVVYQQSQRNVEDMMHTGNTLLASFAQILSEHETMGRGWLTLGIALALLLLATVSDVIVSRAAGGAHARERIGEDHDYDHAEK